MTVHAVSRTAHRERDYPDDPAVLDALWRMEASHFWHAARERWILRALLEHGAREGDRVLEVGCGGGAVVGALHRAGYRVTGVDTSEALIRKADERHPDVDFVIGEVADIPASLRGPYAVIGFFDVLEHLDDPGRLLAESLRWAAANALVLATVPALPELFSTIDRLSGHKRRYRVGELAGLFESAGLGEVVEHGIFRSTLAMQRWFRRRREREESSLAAYLRIPPRPVNALLGGLCALECRLGFAASRGRSGASLLAVGRLR